MRACVPFTGSIPTQLCIGWSETTFHTAECTNCKLKKKLKQGPNFRSQFSRFQKLIPKPYSILQSVQIAKTQTRSQLSFPIFRAAVGPQTVFNAVCKSREAELANP